MKRVRSVLVWESSEWTKHPDNPTIFSGRADVIVLEPNGNFARLCGFFYRGKEGRTFLQNEGFRLWSGSWSDDGQTHLYTKSTPHDINATFSSSGETEGNGRWEVSLGRKGAILYAIDPDRKVFREVSDLLNEEVINSWVHELRGR